MQKIIRNILRRAPENILPPSTISHTHDERAVTRTADPLLYPDLKNLTLKSSSMVPSFYSWLHKVSPAFPVDANKIKILSQPADFYSLLLKKCSSAKQRIVFSSLYLGTGELEQALIETIRQQMINMQGHLKVTFLFDYCRGSRGTVNSRSMVAPLLQQQSNLVQVSLYHSAVLRGLLRWILPQRFNEVVGLQHMKIYIFDDCLIISGANLSHDYFTNRQDRYVVIEDCPELANFYSNLIFKVCEFSFQLLPNGSTTLHSTWPPECHPYLGDKNKFVKAARERVMSAMVPTFSGAEADIKNIGADTWVFPLIQMGQLRIQQDSEVTARLFEQSPPSSKIHLATGYFNLPKQYIDSILSKSQAQFTILTAHPTTNGFLNASGIAGGIPALYTQVAKEFFHKCYKLGHQDRVHIKEYIQDGWTYHGKGLWMTLPGQQNPSLTLIGSPNFGSRSLDRDLETQLAVVTSNPDLQRRLAEERERLYSKGALVTKSVFMQEDRLVPLWVYCISKVFRRLF